MPSGCMKKEHKERAKRYKYCFLCGQQIGEESKPYLTHCPKCGNPAHIDWAYCGWCGGKIHVTGGYLLRKKIAGVKAVRDAVLSRELH
jgi:predicted RNA-binding Zn-ribbon protein involved in translation (DUF1610 family)